jgi:hypothetical protein
VIFDRILDDAALFPPLRAKFRTGGVTADAYPDEPELAEAIHLTVAHGLAFKATAGLTMRSVTPIRPQDSNSTGSSTSSPRWPPRPTAPVPTTWLRTCDPATASRWPNTLPP